MMEVKPWQVQRLSDEVRAEEMRSRKFGHGNTAEVNKRMAAEMERMEIQEHIFRARMKKGNIL
jgi:hypothetical protein